MHSLRVALSGSRGDVFSDPFNLAGVLFQILRPRGGRGGRRNTFGEKEIPERRRVPERQGHSNERPKSLSLVLQGHNVIAVLGQVSCIFRSLIQTS